MRMIGSDLPLCPDSSTEPGIKRLETTFDVLNRGKSPEVTWPSGG